MMEKMRWLSVIICLFLNIGMGNAQQILQQEIEEIEGIAAIFTLKPVIVVAYAVPLVETSVCGQGFGQFSFKEEKLQKEGKLPLIPMNRKLMRYIYKNSQLDTLPISPYIKRVHVYSSGGTKSIEWNFYPNPTQNWLKIDAEKEMYGDIEVIDCRGITVLSFIINGSSTVINLENLIDGTYYLRYNLEGKQVENIGKVVKIK